MPVRLPLPHSPASNGSFLFDWRAHLFAILALTVLTANLHVNAARISANVTNPGGENVIHAGVYANMLSGTPPVKPKREISIEQINKEFVPLISIAETGAMVNFPNRDLIRHHVYSFSPAKTFEIKLYSGVPAKPVIFDKAGEVTLGCNIHDSMLAYVLVVDTPFFAKTDAKGRALIDGLPAGEYEIHMWYPGGAAMPPPQRVKLGATDNAEVKFVYNAKPLALNSPAAPGIPSAPSPATGK